MTNPLPGSMLLVLPVPFRLGEAGTMLFEEQACNGLDRWADNFSHLTVAAPVIPERLATQQTSTKWRDVGTLEHRSRMTLLPLPWAYSPRGFLRSYIPAGRQLSQAIDASEYLQFAIGALIGDWAGVAAGKARRRKRKYAIHTDRVEDELLLRLSRGQPIAQRAKARLLAGLMRRYHHGIIRHCALGLWHGDDCHQAYAPVCQGQNRLIHDVHTKPEDAIPQDELACKLARAADPARPLQVVYAGRIDPMKAPLDWLQALVEARRQGASLQAVWYGEGPLRKQAETEAVRLGMADVVRFPGFVADRKSLLDQLRTADVMLFTLVTPESPRCLLESLISGTPILGYASAFPAELLHNRGGGALTPMHDAAALGQKLATIAADRAALVQMTKQAAQNGSRFNDAAVFAERSALIQEYCK